MIDLLAGTPAAGRSRFASPRGFVGSGVPGDRRGAARVACRGRPRGGDSVHQRAQRHPRGRGRRGADWRRVRGGARAPAGLRRAGSASRGGGLKMTPRFELKEIELHGHRVAYRSAGSGPVIVLVHGITSTSATWERVMPDARQALHGDRARPARARRARPSPAATTRSAPTRAGCATCWSRSATSARRSSGTRSAAASRCSSPTSSPSAASASSWSTAAASGREVNLLLRAATLPGSEFVLPLLASEPRSSTPAAAWAACFGRLGLHVQHRHRRDGPRPRLAGGPRRARGLRPHAAHDRRSAAASGSTPTTGSISPRTSRS